VRLISRQNGRRDGASLCSGLLATFEETKEAVAALKGTDPQFTDGPKTGVDLSKDCQIINALLTPIPCGEHNPLALTCGRLYVAVTLSVSNDISCIPVA